MAREITISASTRPVCSSFFKIREQDSEYQSMEEFTYTHSEIDNSLLQKCFIKYRDKDELTYEQYVERFHEFVGTMRFVNFKPSPFILEQSIKPSVYFAQKADECLQAARFFTIKSYKLFDSDDNLSGHKAIHHNFSSDACTLEQPQRGTLILTIKYYKRCIGGKSSILLQS